MDICVVIRENVIPSVTAVLLWMEMRFIAYEYYAVRSKVVDMLIAINFMGEFFPAPFSFMVEGSVLLLLLEQCRVSSVHQV